jgi:hypothetical protein
MTPRRADADADGDARIGRLGSAHDQACKCNRANRSFCE